MNKMKVTQSLLLCQTQHALRCMRELSGDLLLSTLCHPWVLINETLGAQ